jgi:hypothetical protein
VEKKKGKESKERGDTSDNEEEMRRIVRRE